MSKKTVIVVRFSDYKCNYVIEFTRQARRKVRESQIYSFCSCICLVFVQCTKDCRDVNATDHGLHINCSRFRRQLDSGKTQKYSFVVDIFIIYEKQHREMDTLEVNLGHGIQEWRNFRLIIRKVKMFGFTLNIFFTLEMRAYCLYVGEGEKPSHEQSMIF